MLWWPYGDDNDDDDDNQNDENTFQLASQQHLRTGLGPEEPVKEKIYDITKVIMAIIAVMMMMLVIMLMLMKMCLHFIHDNLHSIWLNGESKAMPMQIVT